MKYRWLLGLLLSSVISAVAHYLMIKYVSPHAFSCLVGAAQCPKVPAFFAYAILTYIILVGRFLGLLGSLTDPTVSTYFETNLFSVWGFVVGAGLALFYHKLKASRSRPIA